MKHKTIFFIGIFLVTVLLVNCSSYVVEPDYWPTTEWRTATPEEQGMSSNKLAAIFDYITGKNIRVDSFLIVRNGYIVLEVYGSKYDSTKQHVLYSVTKSVTSALTGIALDEGYIQSVNQPILDFLPDRIFNNTDENKRAISIEDVLTMRTGIDWELNLRYQLYTEPDLVQFVLDRPVITKPGTAFSYNDGTFFLLSAILQNAVGDSLVDFADRHLFQPLGINNFTWDKSPQGLANTSWGLYLTPRDMAKFGYLYLHDGKWDDKQIVSSHWVKVSTQSHVDLRTATDPVLEPDDEAYGYAWWVYPSKRYYAAQGMDGQQIWIAPDQNLVVIFTAQIDGPTTPLLRPILDDYVIPAIISDRPLDPDPEAHTLLENKSLR